MMESRKRSTAAAVVEPVAGSGWLGWPGKATTDMGPSSSEAM